MEDLLMFTAKWDNSGASHPLVYHLIDSSVVAAALWKYGLTEGARQEIADWLNIKPNEAGQLVAFWTALHDLGKAAPSFQQRCLPARQALETRGFAFPSTGDNVRHHSLLSAWILQSHLEELNLAPRLAAKKLTMAIAGHHGIFPSNGQYNEEHHRQVNLGDTLWAKNQTDLFYLVRRLFIPPAIAQLQAGQTVANAFFDILTGLFITADWLASNTKLFPYCQADIPPEKYLQDANARAISALQETGWIGWQPDDATKSFPNLFPDKLPNPIQQAVIDQCDALQDPFLMILEAPTGSGKTEAALYTADYWMQQHQLRGCYVAMPTQATSNQMFDRFCNYLNHRFPDRHVINAHLVHGNALIKDEYQKLQLAGINDEEDDSTGGVRALSWFTPRKQTLLAPFGVGTVDQAFLSVLQARHFSLRLFGLFRKVIIFDEVHAYDVYMIEIFKRLLAWLRAIGSSVIILSATLPCQTRRELLESFNPQASLDSLAAPFPRLSLNNNLQIKTVSLGTTANRTIQLERIDRRPESILAVLQTKLAEGGCAAVVCNTVGRAQQVYRALLDSGAFAPQELTLFHSRFPYCWREQCEGAVLKKFGRLNEPASKARHGIVVATQVIEQSLDLDFDLLISDLAPLDLLIQRIGRLQRHTHMPNPPQRPRPLDKPLCVVAMPERQGDELANFEKEVYEEVFLQRSYFVLESKTSLSLPEDSDELIEAVYSRGPMLGLSAAQNEELQRLYIKMSHRAESAGVSANNRLIADVDLDSVLGSGQLGLDEEDPTVHKDMQALTRDTLPSVQLVCIERDSDGQTFLLDGHTLLDLKMPPTGGLLKNALRSVVTVSNSDVVNYFHHQPPYAAWRKSAHLRYAYPLIFEGNVCQLQDNISLYLDPELGIRLEKRK